ncbi:MAG: regulatory protein RecX [Actinomycetaceae bacterium]|nr:regulatory protein RecX [Actinomycetaceae bacterium]
MVSFYDPDEHVKKKHVDIEARKKRRQARIERAASLEGEEAVAEAKEVALRQLDRQDRSRGELESKLRERGYQPDAIEAALDRLAEAGLVDDERFARMLVRTRHSERGLVGRALVQELRKKKIPPHVIDVAMEEVEDADPEAVARDLVERRARSMTGVDREKQFRRLTSFLARKGYSPGMCMHVVNSVLDEQGEGVEHD